MEAELCVDARCTLGEGPVWNASRGELLWTDIQESVIWRYSPANGGSERTAVPDRVGFLAVTTKGGLLLGQHKALVVVLKGDGRKVADVEIDVPSTRINDGRTDRAGNAVFGTMSEADGHPAEGAIYQYSTSRGLRRLDLGNVGIANSICFSLDGRTMWFSDSPKRIIYRCDYDAASAGVSNIRVFVDMASEQGQPDGSVIDADGCLWNAVWGASEVRRYTPDGRLERVVRVPTKNPTCPAFGGADLRTLYVTSSRQDHTGAELAAAPHAGGVFSLRLDRIAGVADALFVA